MNRNTGLMAMITSMVFWGFGNPFSDYAVESFNPSQMYVVEVLSGSAVFFLLVLAVPRLRNNIGVIPWRLSIPLGIAMPGLCYYLGNIGFQYGSVTTGVILLSCEAIFLAFGGVWILKEPLPLRAVIAICLGMVGVFIVGISGNASNPETAGVQVDLFGFSVPAGMVGAAAFLVSSVFSAGFGLAVRKYGSSTDIIGLTIGQLISASVLGLIVAVVDRVNLVAMSQDVDHFMAALAAGVLGIGVAFLLFNAASENVSARQTALTLNLIPVIAITFGAIIGRGLPTSIQVVGAAVVLVSLFFLETEELAQAGAIKP